MKTAASRRGEPIGRWVERAVRNQLIAEYRDRHGYIAIGHDRCHRRGCQNPRNAGSMFCQPCDLPDVA